MRTGGWRNDTETYQRGPERGAYQQQSSHDSHLGTDNRSKEIFQVDFIIGLGYFRQSEALSANTAKCERSDGRGEITLG